jgi:hypothetical protein
MRIDFSILVYSVTHEEYHEAHYPPGATSTTAKGLRWIQQATFFEKKPKRQDAQTKPTK